MSLHEFISKINLSTIMQFIFIGNSNAIHKPYEISLHLELYSPSTFVTLCAYNPFAASPNLVLFDPKPATGKVP